jgi:hypothetical protein
MDKFVQLPFLIPPTEPESVKRYTAQLFSIRTGAAATARADELAQTSAPQVTTRTAAAAEADRLQKEHNLSEGEAARLRDQLEARVVERELDKGIEQFTDENPETRGAVETAVRYFRGNPRDLKRFINAYRFNYFLWHAHRAQGLKGPGADQLLRWTVLCVKWPEVVRWLRRSGGSDWQATPASTATTGAAAAVPTRLKRLEDISGGATNLLTWHEQAQEVLRLDPVTTTWLNDDNLLEFLHDESHQNPEGQRLSDGVGRGLWRWALSDHDIRWSLPELDRPARRSSACGGAWPGL